MKVIKAQKDLCDKFIKLKHYSHKPAIFWEGFCLVENEKIRGVIVYGQPPPPIQKHAFTNRGFRLYELNRLVIQSKNKNAASFLIGNSLKMLEKPCAVVSYADTEFHHCGIVYQATNWYYTGKTVSHDHTYIIDNKRVHSISLRNKNITSPKTWAKHNNIQTIEALPKHRYFQFVGTKKEKKQMKEKLNYKIYNKYPKCKQIRYDDGPRIDIKQEIYEYTKLF